MRLKLVWYDTHKDEIVVNSVLDTMFYNLIKVEGYELLGTL